MVGEVIASMYISLLAYDAESDELDLLIDAKSPMPAESIPAGEGIYIRRDPSSGRVVGAFIRGYSHLLKKVHAGVQVSDKGAKRLGVHEAFQAVLQWVGDQSPPSHAFK
jgi:hypothetical protein